MAGGKTKSSHHRKSNKSEEEVLHSYLPTIRFVKVIHYRMFDGLDRLEELKVGKRSCRLA